ncbi:hypothetical protein QYF36_017579 [Acer negundo]|nr:hypothetical protein QYF36_017579 [Acer negundo]
MCLGKNRVLVRLVRSLGRVDQRMIRMVLGCKCHLEGTGGIMWVQLLVVRNLALWETWGTLAMIADMTVDLFLMELNLFERETYRKKQVPSTVSKYLVFKGANESLFNSAFKENLGGNHCSEESMGSNKDKQGSTVMEEDIEDSDVLRSLHKDMMESV